MEILARLTAALSDRYRIERELGQGGMATVYLAEDLKHKRKVALKVLKPELAAVLGAERFVQEITTTAALQHPHILPLFDSGSAGQGDGGTEFLYYVMPFIDGETLRAKLDRETQLGVAEAVTISSEVADALDYAHRHGVIHRDIKPENILLHEGRPMVADFGIALAVSAAAGGRMTETGLSLGTPHYMSPEQATAEKEISARSDVYSLGSVLYEMLTGSPPHVGASAQQIIMKIVTEEAAPVTRLRKAVPHNVAAAVAQAIQKLPADRFESAAQFAGALRDPHFVGTAGATAASAGATGVGGAWNRLTMSVAALAAILAVVAAWAITTRPVAAPNRVLRTVIALPDSVILFTPTFGSRVAVSRDGSRMVVGGYGSGGRQLWLRQSDRLDAVPIPGTSEAHAPFFSPDGTRLAFFTVEPTVLKVVAFDGGPATVLADTGLRSGRRAQPAAAVWGMDGAIYSGSLDGVIRIPEAGGRWTMASSLDTLADEKGHTPTDALPNGRGLIMTVAHTPNTMVSLYDVAVLDLQSGSHKILTRAVYGRYVAPGYLVVVRADGVMLAASFDPDRLELTGPLVALGSEVDASGGFLDFAVTDDGSLLHVERPAGVNAAELIWVRRDGTVSPFDPGWHADFESVAFSPDGSQLAAGAFTRDGAELWIRQMPDGPQSRLTTEGPINYRPTWMPDGKRVAFRTMNTATGRFEFVAKRADGIGPTELLASEQRSIATGVISADGQWRIYRSDATEGGRGDILALRTGDSVPVPLVATPAEERYPALSPDGRWLAYRSDEGGSAEIWVRPFPNVNEGKFQVSLNGGTEPLWSHSGRELFYVTPGNELVAASVATSPAFVVTRRETLFAVPGGVNRNIATAAYDITPDDSRFLMIRSQTPGLAGAVVSSTSGERVILVEHWVEELKARVPR